MPEEDPEKWLFSALLAVGRWVLTIVIAGVVLVIVVFGLLAGACFLCR